MTVRTLLTGTRAVSAASFYARGSIFHNLNKYPELGKGHGRHGPRAGGVPIPPTDASAGARMTAAQRPHHANHACHASAPPEGRSESYGSCRTNRAPQQFFTTT